MDYTICFANLSATIFRTYLSDSMKSVLILLFGSIFIFMVVITHRA